MAGIYTVQLGMVRADTGLNGIVFTSSATGVTVIRDLIVMATATAGVQVSVTIPTPGGSPVFLLRDLVKDGTTLHRDTRQVVPPGVNVQWALSAASIVTILVTGYVFKDPVVIGTLPA